MKILYYDCFAGISGDMNLGALIDLGVDQNHLIEELKKLNIGSYEIAISRGKRKGISGTRVEVIVSSGKHLPDGHASEERSFREIIKLVEESTLSDNVKTISLNIFTKIARAEANIHGCSIDDVHFHEIGSIDSIVDIIGAALCLDLLNVDRILSSPVQVGGGFVTCSHGILPVPAPATADILKDIPIKSGIVPYETTTPTGAAILAATVNSFTENIHFIPRQIGYGIGQRDTDIPNVLRVFLGEIKEDVSDDDVETEDAYLIECNIDDMNPENYDHVVETLFERGASDVFLTPIIMKKTRPAVKMSVLCNIKQKKDIEEVLWLQTTTFGLRVKKISKVMLRRDFSKVMTEYGEVSTKHAYFRGREIKSKPEYEDCKRLAREKGVSVKEIYDSLKRAKE